ncbi:MAG: hypothetical protein HZC54_01280 [Verrucomicrobia bacterium]|nr:hypothetical protein [Verrucomicrobiota bacterium]
MSLPVKATVAHNAVATAPATSDPKIVEHFKMFISVCLTLANLFHSSDAPPNPFIRWRERFPLDVRIKRPAKHHAGAIHAGFKAGELATAQQRQAQKRTA